MARKLPPAPAWFMLTVLVAMAVIVFLGALLLATDSAVIGEQQDGG